MTLERTGWILAAIFAIALAGALWKLVDLYAETRLQAALTPPPETAGSPPAEWPAAPLRVIMIGDSRVARWTPLPEASGLSVWVRGVGGEVTAATLARLEADALAHHPNAVVVLSGINDMVAASLNPGAAARVMAETKTNLSAIAKRAQNAGVPLVLASIIRPAHPSALRWLMAWNGRIREQTEQMNQHISALATIPGVTLLDADGLLTEGARAAVPLPGTYATDTLHLTSRAYRVLNEGLLAALDEALSSNKKSAARL